MTDTLYTCPCGKQHYLRCAGKVGPAFEDATPMEAIQRWVKARRDLERVLTDGYDNWTPYQAEVNRAAGVLYMLADEVTT